jgi:hypothetical protein
LDHRTTTTSNEDNYDSNTITNRDRIHSLSSKERDIKTIVTLSDMGRRVKESLLLSKSISNYSNSNKDKISFDQISFQFDLDPLSLSDIPLMLTGSKQVKSSTNTAL